MRFPLLLLLLLLLGFTRASFDIGPFINANITVALADWQPCYLFEASSYSATFADIAALCPGPLAFGQTSAIDPFSFATYVRAFANVSIDLSPPASAAWGAFSFYLTSTALNYGNASLTDCSTATTANSIFCWSVNGSGSSFTFAPGGFAANGDGYQTQSSINRVLYSAPCYGKAYGSACSVPFAGVCETGFCLGNNSCVNTTVAPAPFISNTTCMVPGLCNPYNGSYSIIPKTNGSSCFYGNYCIANDACFAGVCVPGNYTNACPLPSSICYQAPICHSSNVTFSCTYPLNDGTTCQADSQYLCRTGDVCNAGSCIPGANLTLTYNLTTCATAYSCNATTGIITPTAAPLGTPCSPSNPCFSSGVCNNTICYGTTPTVPPIAPTGCLSATCDASTGNFTYNFINTGLSCTPVGAPNDTCNEYVCLAGNCTFSQSTFCPPLTCQSGTCVNGTGCIYTPLNGTACGTASLCNGYGLCITGSCVNSGALNCTNTFPTLDPFCGYAYCDNTRGCQVNATHIGQPCSSNVCVPAISSFCNLYGQCGGKIVPTLPGCFLSPAARILPFSFSFPFPFLSS